MYSPADYLAQLQAALPPGKAWTRMPDKKLTQLLGAYADGFADADARIDALLAELDPRSTLEMLPDWERAFGLPDPCVIGPQSLQQRRAALVAQITDPGGQSIAYFTALAASLGHTIVIEEFRPSRCGVARCGERLHGSLGWAFLWRVKTPLIAQPIRGRAGTARCGERLLSFGVGALECAIKRRAPAHTTVIFAYLTVYAPLGSFVLGLNVLEPF